MKSLVCGAYSGKRQVIYKQTNEYKCIDHLGSNSPMQKIKQRKNMLQSDGVVGSRWSGDLSDELTCHLRPERWNEPGENQRRCVPGRWNELGLSRLLN